MKTIYPVAEPPCPRFISMATNKDVCARYIIPLAGPGKVWCSWSEEPCPTAGLREKA
jgi:hypothetical protein